MKRYALVLAAGKGTRMKTETPKVAFPILKKPMIEYIVENIEKSVVDDIYLVVGYQHEVVEGLIKDRAGYIYQHEQLGTGHAALMAAPTFKDLEGSTFIMPGDVPLIYYKQIDKMFKVHEENGNDLTVVTAIYEDPKGYGRILRNEQGQIQGIIEDRDANDYQKQIKEINTGIYIVNNHKFFNLLGELDNKNAKGEYYITDMIALMKRDYKVGAYTVRNNSLVMGVNDLYGISVAEKYLREYINKEHMLNGVSMINPETITIGHNVIIEPGVTINPNTTITGYTVIKTGAIVGPNSEVHNSEIHERVHVKHSLIYDSIVREDTTVGPFAHLRDHADIGAHNRIGNFVEVKKSSTGDETKASHLAYIGDSVVGSNVNFGCGSVTVNYDGVKKHQTKIGDNVFIGCNTNLIAPIEVGDNVFIAAGSTVTKNIPSNGFAIARSRQVTKEDYAKYAIKPKVKDKV
ncbi:Bifunctional protein GlmU [Acholeplasma oculi]|uniref:Bifunctional protein GlmU n=1 Tax=Acholeplasma oculi TaxID=35623 RepID=A0A061AFZ9_9MOLU|nr:bifunctional UDP-N-acetylglucosamine diphosphorylase/glucosamine-1-phosphate N-acetyltransferase GlmU [Acholeplasma oculi]CDR30501.1 Bifunctional protein, N-acetylglucosamine-1-phosphate uridyltransferase/Glucosamine-1-phosphate N-acetyltransferase [Acholeplasma oculi]SKC47894.1 bifunctional UDP-N-acetylglucosamine pyrophosphorylase / Glucosamine-1-phosphate N-acetyltransferase [Acholeplasma oculi]SUT89140.1 Bifunctional protein GlmU [Acholeplasma oculi]